MFWLSFLYLLGHVSRGPSHSIANSDEGEVIEKWHPLLPVEKKLIVYCLIIAAIAMLLLIWVSYTFFNVGTT
jgi:hypothetical protein